MNRLKRIQYRKRMKRMKRVNYIYNKYLVVIILVAYLISFLSSFKDPQGYFEYLMFYNVLLLVILHQYKLLENIAKDIREHIYKDKKSKL
jgi:hypothetical protein